MLNLPTGQSSVEMSTSAANELRPIKGNKCGQLNRDNRVATPVISTTGYIYPYYFEREKILAISKYNIKIKNL